MSFLLLLQLQKIFHTINFRRLFILFLTLVLLHSILTPLVYRLAHFAQVADGLLSEISIVSNSVETSQGIAELFEAFEESSDLHQKKASNLSFQSNCLIFLKYIYFLNHYSVALQTQQYQMGSVHVMVRVSLNSRWHIPMPR